MGSHDLHYKCKRERAVDKEVAMSFNIASVLSIEVDEMCIEGEGREAEEE